MKVQDTKCYIGVDVSKSSLDVFILPHNKYMQFKNNPNEIEKFAKKCKIFSNTSIVLEATGGYEKVLVQSLHKHQLTVSVSNPRQIRDFARALGRLAKTDKIDAHTIALYAEKIQPKPQAPIGETQQKLVENNSRRRQLIDMITMEKNRLDKASPELKKSIERVIKTLTKELEQINQAQEKMIEADSRYQQKNQLLKTVKGIGSVVAAGILSSLPELGELSQKQITALAGLAPYSRDSGCFRGKRMIGGGRPIVRNILYMATLVAIRHNGQIKQFYERLCSAGKLKKVAIIASMHKLLIIINAIIKNNQPWQYQNT